MFCGIMALKILLLLLLLPDLLGASLDYDQFFRFHGFQDARISMDGESAILSDGLLMLTSGGTSQVGHAFYFSPLRFKESPASNVSSFSCTFVFGIVPQNPGPSGQGIALVFTPSREQIFNNIYSPAGYLGILNPYTDGNRTNHLLAVELDTIQNPEFGDIDDNHVGIDISSMRSVTSSTAGYYPNGTHEFKNLTLISGDPIQVWVEYDGGEMKLNVTLSPIGVAKPSIPLLSSTIDLSQVMEEEMYVGFSSTTGPYRTSHYILGWSFRMPQEADPLYLPFMPSLPRMPRQAAGKHKKLALVISLSLVTTILIVAAGMFMVVRKIKFSELLEDWEVDYGTRRFSYRDLYAATGGFKEKGLLGRGGFGKVYKGVLPTSKMEVAVKRVAHDSKQGMREFIAEIVSIGRLRHRNLVQFLGYCRRKGELLLVYSYMPGGSLDKLLFDPTKPAGLNWNQRFQIIKGVASGLLYLHEEWEKVVIHRDVKASNVLLDGDLNGKLSDFGLARLHDHGNDPSTTHVAGTMGYLAPELARTGKASKATDVFAFGVFLLEVACGRRPVEHQAPADEVVLLDRVLRSWRKGTITECADPRLAGEYAAGEVELMLKLGLLCAHPQPATRPTMRQVMQHLDGDAPPPELSWVYADATLQLEVLQKEMVDRHSVQSPSLSTNSLFFAGR